jgi:4-amino-4-deoxy-L-arabinose transferase-like glycosyltransferase
MVRVRPVWLFAIAALVLAAFNVTFRLGGEVLTEWDESLYATSALEMVQGGSWVATTFDGALDYYNSKPPLNVWLLALSLQTFGVSLVSLRLPSALAAWTTVVVLLAWAWRRFSPLVAILSAWVLATCFGFLAVHSGRTANPDALLTLVLLLIVVILDTSRSAPVRRVWLGPLLAGVFLVKGMAVFLPVLLIMWMEWRRRMTPRDRWVPLAIGFGVGAIPAALWAVARWQIDHWTFFERMIAQDLIGVTTSVLDGHAKSPFFYLDVLQKHHYDWLIAAAAAILLVSAWSRSAVGRMFRFWRSDDDLLALIGGWVVMTLLVPSLLQTKLPWYLNPFYPLFALGVGWVLAHACARVASATPHRRVLLIMVVAGASVVAEAKLVWHSHQRVALDRSVQHLLVNERARLRGTRVFRSTWGRADSFMLKGVVEGEPAEAGSLQDFLSQSVPGEYWLSSDDVDHPGLLRVATVGEYRLFQRHFDAPPSEERFADRLKSPRLGRRGWRNWPPRRARRARG